MDIALYGHVGNCYMEAVGDNFKEDGLEVETHKRCLCDVDPDTEFPPVVLCHPAQGGTECFQGVRRVVAANPYTDFYIIALGYTSNRVRGIGEHFHVCHMDGDESWEDLQARIMAKVEKG